MRMKKFLWIIGFATLAVSGCDNSHDELSLSGKCRMVAFSLVKDGEIYEATVTDNGITVSVPYNLSLAGASALIELSENAAIRPDPAIITDWNQEWQFLVTSADGCNDRCYRYTVVREDIAATDDITLRTQSDVDAFGANAFNAIDGNLIIGDDGIDNEDPIMSLDGLANLNSVRGALIVTNACRTANLDGLANLVFCGSLEIGSADIPHSMLQSVDLPALVEVGGDIGIFASSLETAYLNALRHVAGDLTVRSDRLAEFMSDELTEIGGNLTFDGRISNVSTTSSPCNQLFLPKLTEVGGTVMLSRFDRLSGLATSFGALTSTGGVRYEHLAKANTVAFPRLEIAGEIVVDDCPLLKSISLPMLVSAASLSVTDCPSVYETDLSAMERIDGDILLQRLPRIEKFDALFPRLAAIGGDLTFDDMPSLAGTIDISRCRFSRNSTVSFRFVSPPKITDIHGGDFCGSLTLDATTLTPQPETMPFEIIDFGEVNTIRIIGFSSVESVTLPITVCENMFVENCGSQMPFALSLPALAEVKGSLVLRNCGKAGAENSASFPALKRVGRQLALYVRGSAFTSLELPELETVGDGEPVSDDPSSDYALYAMPSGCNGMFAMPKLRRVDGNMLISTWNSITDRTTSFEFPALEVITGRLFIGHDRYPNRTVGSLDFSALVDADAVYVGNLKSVDDFSTFSKVIPMLSEDTWTVENCGANPTYVQMKNNILETTADR